MIGQHFHFVVNVLFKSPPFYCSETSFLDMFLNKPSTDSISLVVSFALVPDMALFWHFSGACASFAQALGSSPSGTGHFHTGKECRGRPGGDGGLCRVVLCFHVCACKGYSSCTPAGNTQLTLRLSSLPPSLYASLSPILPPTLPPTPTRDPSQL